MGCHTSLKLPALGLLPFILVMMASGPVHAAGPAVDLKIPEALKLEHEELHADLARAIGAGGKTGEAAKAVAKVLHPHFVKEEEYALPPLGLLPSLARNEAAADMRAALAMTDKLKAELPGMLAEHRAIVAALKGLSEAAMKEGKPEHAHFAEKLILHAQTEETVLYPASILVGEYLKLKTGK